MILMNDEGEPIGTTHTEPDPLLTLSDDAKYAADLEDRQILAILTNGKMKHIKRMSNGMKELHDSGVYIHITSNTPWNIMNLANMLIHAIDPLANVKYDLSNRM